MRLCIKNICTIKENVEQNMYQNTHKTKYKKIQVFSIVRLHLRSYIVPSGQPSSPGLNLGDLV